MQLTPREKDKLLISVAAMVARSRLDRGVKLVRNNWIVPTKEPEIGLTARRRHGTNGF